MSLTSGYGPFGQQPDGELNFTRKGSEKVLYREDFPKGEGQHWNLTVGESTVLDAAWTLPNPLGEADVIVDYFCFYPKAA